MSLQSQKCLEFNTSMSEQQKCQKLRKGGRFIEGYENSTAVSFCNTFALRRKYGMSCYIATKADVAFNY